MKSFCLVLLVIPYVILHSWLSCVDYTSEGDRVYDPTKCRGYPRNWDVFNFGFGVDRGYEFRGRGCSTLYTRTYSTQYPMAQYEVGKKYTLVYPAKNHVAAVTDYDGGPCANPTNVYIPDRGIQLSLLPFSPNGDQTAQEFDTFNITPFGRGVHQNGVTDYLGFQWCPGFCQNNDKSACFANFTVPNVPTGIYTFRFLWEFNENEYYTTCFDATITNPSTQPITSSSSSLSPSSSTSQQSSTLSSSSQATSSIATSQVQTTASITPTSQVSTSIPATSTAPTSNSGSTCSFTWQCQDSSENYNFVQCISGKCKCNSGFTGDATTSSKCRCAGTLEWSNGVPYCLSTGQCITAQNCPPRTCTGYSNGIGFCY